MRIYFQIFNHLPHVNNMSLVITINKLDKWIIRLSEMVHLHDKPQDYHECNAYNAY